MYIIFYRRISPALGGIGEITACVRVGRGTTPSPNRYGLLIGAQPARRSTIQPTRSAQRRLAALEAELGRTTFAWTGANDVNIPTCMIVQGPTVIIGDCS